MPLQAIEPQRLYQQVADQLADLIRGGEFAVGQRLPPERDLAKKLGVSRPVVREAMVALEIVGLVEVRTGSGAYVRALTSMEPSSEPPMEDAGPSPFDLIGARKMIEGETAAEAAARATPADIERIAAAMREMERAPLGSRDHREADRVFHAAIAAATGNTVLVSIVENLWLGMYEPVFLHLSDRTGLPKNQAKATEEHGAVFDRIRRHDSAGARDAMRRHLAKVEEVMMSDDES